METNEKIQLALQGDKEALEALLMEVQDDVFNLSLRMLGMVEDAKDATQEIMIKVMTNLGSFRNESKFSTWVYRIACNYLIDYKKHRFAHQPLSFEFYEADLSIQHAVEDPSILCGKSEDELANELRASCTNVLLQCLDPQNRCIFLLGTMFHVDSAIASEVLGISADNYRQKLSRSRKKVREFLEKHCLEQGDCNCKNRLEIAIQQHRLLPTQLAFQELVSYQRSVEQLDVYSATYLTYRSPIQAKNYVEKLMKSRAMNHVLSFEETKKA